MWRITIIANSLLMFLFWVTSIIAITPAYNHFVQYSEAGNALPIPTELAISVRMFAIAIPVAWVLLSFFIYKNTRTKTPEHRTEYLLAFTSVTLVSGFSMLIFFILSGILPYLKFNAFIR